MSCRGVFRVAVLTLLVMLTPPLPRTGLAANTLNGLRVEPPKQIAAQSMLDHDGRSIRFPAKDTSWTLVFFGYTHCPDVCPATMFKLRQVVDMLGEDRGGMAIRFVSVDSQRDTPEQLKKFVTFYGADVVGITGSPEALQSLQRDFGVTTRKFQGKTALSYTLEHSVFMYLLDKNGRLRFMYPANLDARDIVSDLRRLHTVN